MDANSYTPLITSPALGNHLCDLFSVNQFIKHLGVVNTTARRFTELGINSTNWHPTLSIYTLHYR